LVILTVGRFSGIDLLVMARTLKQDRKKAVPQMPFNEALKLVWASPPQPKIAKKKAARKGKKDGRPDEPKVDE
jgi:hypothetical protein